MSLRVLVVDWDERARAELVALVHRHLPSAEVVTCSGAVEAEVLALRGRPFDLVLVEYQLTDGYGPRVADTFTTAGAVAIVVSSVGALSPAARARVVPKAEAPARMAGWLEEYVHAGGRNSRALIPLTGIE